MSGSPLNRRRLLVGGLAGLVMPAIIPSARAGQPIDAFADFGLDPGESETDHTAKLQAALDAAAREGRILLLPRGGLNAGNLTFPDELHLLGVPGQTFINAPGDRRLAHIEGAVGMVIENVIFQANAPDSAAGINGLIEIEGSDGISFVRCGFNNTAGNCIAAVDSALTIDNCDLDGAEAAAIHSQNGRGIAVRGSRISNCGNAGIRIWRDEPGDDGSIITGNSIRKIDWRDGGNGQNGNGVSIYKANGVTVADNHFAGCTFSAVRVNSGKNTMIRGNTCLASGEVAIFSEFAFSGSVIADNIIDGAATGISITNLDSGGHLATCTGNIVRNITPKSETNPDTRPVGIYAEADTIVANNTIDSVPGIGIIAGYGPYVRNIVVSSNVLTSVTTGIGVSVVQEPSPGPVRVTGNLIGAGAQAGVIGMEWEKVVSDDLARDASLYPNVTVSENSIG